MVNRKGWLTSCLALLVFLSSLPLWPNTAGTLPGPASFIPHGLFLLWAVRRPTSSVWLWPLPAWALASQWAGPLWAGGLALSLYLTAGAAWLAGIRRSAHDLSSPPVLFRLLPAVLLAPAAATAILLRVLQGLVGADVPLLQALLQYGALALALTLCVPAAFAAGVHSRRRYAELPVIVLLTLSWWATLFGVGHVPLVPVYLLLYPFMLWAAYRGGIVGATLLGLLVMVLAVFLDAPSFQPLPLPANGIVLNLALVLSALLVAVQSEAAARQVRQLQDSLARFDALLRHSPNVMSLKDLDGRYLLVNRAYSQALGKAPAELIGKKSTDFLSPEEAQLATEQDQQVLNALESRQYEQTLTLAGLPSDFLVTKFPLFDANGLLAGIGCIATDISQNKREQQAKQEAENRYHALIEQSLVGIYILQDERLAYVNDKLAEMLGYRGEDLLGQKMDKVLAREERQQLRQQINQRLRENIAIMHFATRLVRHDGLPLDVEIHSRLFDYQGHRAIIGVVVDISDRVQADANQKLASKVFENAAEGILITGADYRIIAVNQAFTRITGYLPEQVIGRMSRIFRDDTSWSSAMLDGLARHGHWHGEMLDRRRSHEWYPAELSISAVRDDAGVVSNYVGVFADITVRKQAEERLQFLANHDPLTRLPNRSWLIARLEDRIQHLDCSGQQVAVMFLDLDRFKLINDSFGHQTGDELLRETANRLEQVVGSRGEIARLGGDEFTLLVSHFASQATLSALAEDILAVLAQPLRLEGQELIVTGSLGISVYPCDGSDARTLLKNADVAMYRAKEAGKNTYQFFAAEMNAQAVERLQLENGLRQALERGEFELHFQPILAAATRRLEALEVLLRWRHPELGLVPPGRFIPLAEETGLIRPIGDWVIRQACRQLADWDCQGLHVPRLAINLSARQFEQQSLIVQVAGALAEAGIAAGRLELEMTESMVMQNPTEAVSLLRELKALGVRLSIDDFGTGYSSLSYLKRFPLDTLKIDRSFIEGLPADGDSAAIAEAILALARKLSFSVVAEGVETEAQAAFLTAKGCQLLQGYLFSRPLPAAELPAFLKRQSPQPRMADSGAIVR
ncbi:MAG: EAL domain-containing protein [Pseudogulbenkiania sp.]|nr:EAL domain-containing protein [Pseudogulbenkiania sp.]